MYLYKYDRETKEYLGYFEAYLDPLETLIKGEDIYVIPPCSTLSVPSMPTDDKHVAVYDEERGVWKEVEDNRGLVLWTKNGEPVTLTKLGAIPEDLLKERPISLREAKELKIDEIKKVFNEEYFKKVKINETEVGIDDSARIREAVGAFKDYETLVVNIGTEVVEAPREQLEEIVKEFYIRSMLLTRRRKSLIMDVREQKSKEQVANLIIDFNIEEDVERLKALSSEELANELKE